MIVQGADFASAPEVANHLHAMYALLENAASIGAENTEQAKQIRSAYDTTLAAIYQALKGNAEATQALRSAEEMRWSGSALAQIHGNTCQQLRHFVRVGGEVHAHVHLGHRVACAQVGHRTDLRIRDHVEGAVLVADCGLAQGHCLHHSSQA